MPFIAWLVQAPGFPLELIQPYNVLLLLAVSHPGNSFRFAQCPVAQIIPFSFDAVTVAAGCLGRSDPSPGEVLVPLYVALNVAEGFVNKRPFGPRILSGGCKTLCIRYALSSCRS